jgi:transcriptional/translational regulatory protein YebC/TACO1
MPSENIDRAIKKASGGGASALETVIYEAYGPGGCALMIEVLTRNRNKAAQEIKFILSEQGVALASRGSAAWAFQKTNEGWVPQTTLPLDEESVSTLEKLVDALEAHEDVQVVYTNAE